jgi:sulfur relay (sulfurtransferase) DsrC/TusE family protein
MLILLGHNLSERIAKPEQDGAAPIKGGVVSASQDESTRLLDKCEGSELIDSLAQCKAKEINEFHDVQIIYCNAYYSKLRVSPDISLLAKE